MQDCRVSHVMIFVFVIVVDTVFLDTIVAISPILIMCRLYFGKGAVKEWILCSYSWALTHIYVNF